MSEEYIKGNETLVNNGKAEYEQVKEEYLDALFSMNMTRINIMKAKRKAREEEIQQKFNMTIDEYLKNMTDILEQKKAELESHRPRLNAGEAKVKAVSRVIWALTNCLFVIGGMIGKYN